MDNEQTNTMHLFAGGGGLLADLILGHNPIVAVEWEPYACQTLRERAAEGWFPDLRVWEGDVELFDPSEYAGRVDCLHAGFPCQDISNAGAGAGIGEGTRSGLYREVLRIADTLRPREIFLENVASIISKKDSLSPVAPFRVVNIGNSNKVKLLEFIAAIEEKLGKKAIRNYLPMQTGDVPETWADTSLLKNLTGYKSKIKYEDGIANFIEWYLDYYNKIKH